MISEREFTNKKREEYMIDFKIFPSSTTRLRDCLLQVCLFSKGLSSLARFTNHNVERCLLQEQKLYDRISLFDRTGLVRQSANLKLEIVPAS